jgi:ABC-2 type transport system permease protein
MNAAMIRRLVRKDWTFHRAPIAAGCAAGLVALALVVSGGAGAFYFGTVLLITVVISLGIYLAFTTVINERSEGTLPFVMSLPVSVQEYTAAKLIANLLLFLLPWAALAAGTVLVILSRASIPDGMLPFAVILLVELLAGYVLVLGVALVSESSAWTVGTMVLGNLFVQGFMYVTARLPGIAPTMPTERIVWTPTAVLLLGAELAAVALILLVTWRLQARKTDFL